jgi:hypothetical protein
MNMKNKSIFEIIVGFIAGILLFSTFYLILLGFSKLIGESFSYKTLFYFGYFGMTIGIYLSGQLLLNRNDSKKGKLWKFVGTLIGVVIGSFFYDKLSQQIFGQVPYIYTAWILPVVLPVTCGQIGNKLIIYERNPAQH